ncbi:MAG: GNAT family N-acetyltransferase [Chitinophagales bacterium]
MIGKIILRQETKSDFSEVFEVNHSAFGQENEAKLVEALRYNSAAFVPELSIVATTENKIVGYILFTKINIKNEEGEVNESLALAPMAVRTEFQKSGIGGQLIRKGFKVAKDLGFKSIIVLGHEHYYPKFGFEQAEKWNIKAPFEVPSNFFMAIEMVNDGLKDVSGTVIYPKEFGMV